MVVGGGGEEVMVVVVLVVGSGVCDSDVLVGGVVDGDCCW